MSKEPDPAASDIPPPKKKKLKLFIAVGGVAAALVIAGGLWFSGMFSHSSKIKKPATTAAAGPSAPSQPVFVETPEMVTNLDAGPHRLSFVKVQCKLEVAHPTDVAPLTSAMPRIIDMIQSYLRETRPEDLRSDAGTYRLREAILLRSSLASTGVEIKDVLFEEMIVQ